jgi:two-component system chemotaxis sensor kinase CheA
VIKPLGKVFNLIKGIGGFTILGSGEVALILDVPGLMKQVMSGEQSAEEHKRVMGSNDKILLN